MIPKFGPFEFALAERYRLDEIIGRGAMGIVYRATDVRIQRPVAIKMLRPVLTNEVGVKRFESEIRIAGALSHPNVVPLHDCGEVDGYLYYVMSLGEESLRQRLTRDAPLSIADSITIASDVAAGLQHAHDHDAIHRDIKPENIILDEGRAAIVDFGLARIINDAGSVQLTESGLVVGTPPYLSPEQASAQRQLSPATDQYALACVVFEMLTKDPPFYAATPTALAMRHVSDPPPPVQVRRPEVPPGVADAIARALSKSPDDRFPSVRAFASAMSTALRAPSAERNAHAGAEGFSLLHSLKARWSAVTGRGRNS